jgi:hypothetical protein
MTIQINVTHGRADATDIARAREAAEALLAERGVTPQEAAAEFARQWDEIGDADLLVGRAADWYAAGVAADRALTAGWADPDGASCDIEAA